MKIGIALVSLFLIAGFALSATTSAEETTVFGPETFIKQKGKPQVVERSVVIDSSDWMFTVQVQNGVSGSRSDRVSGATIILNGIPVGDREDINKQTETFETPVTFLVEGENTLGVELKGSPGSFISVKIIKEPFRPNRGVQNADGDLDAWNTGDYVALGWVPPPADTVKLILYRSLSADGPWDKINEMEIRPYDPASGYWESQVNPNNTVDFVDGRAADLYYRLEAISETGEVLRSYAPVHVPKFVEETLTQSRLSEDDSFVVIVDGEAVNVKWRKDFTLGRKSISEEIKEAQAKKKPKIEISSVSPPYNEPFLTDEEYENFDSMTLVQIQDFLKEQDSFLSGTIEDVDGKFIDPARLIYDAAQKYKVSPQLLLTTIQKESRSIVHAERRPDDVLKLIMGYSIPSTIRDQIDDAAWQFSKYFHDLETKGITVSGWQVGVAKETQDQITVTPANKAVAALFSYTPWVGGGWGGREGGNYLFWDLWYNQFKFTVKEEITRTAVADSWIMSDQPDLNVGTLDILAVGYVDQSSIDGPIASNRRGIIKSNISNIDVANITSAKVQLTYYYTVPIFAVTSGTFPVNVYKISSDWTETAVTWNNVPPYGELIGSFMVTATDDPQIITLNLDVTDYVKTAGTTELSIFLISSGEDLGQDIAQEIIIFSREREIVEQRPKIIIY